MDLWVFIYIVMFLISFLTVLTALIIPPLRTWWGMLGLGLFWTYTLTKLGQMLGWV